LALSALLGLATWAWVLPARALGPEEVVPFKQEAMRVLKGGLKVSPALRSAVVKLATMKAADGWRNRGLNVFGRTTFSGQESRAAVLATPGPGRWDLRWWKGGGHYSMPDTPVRLAKLLPSGNTVELEVKVVPYKKWDYRATCSFVVVSKSGKRIAQGSSFNELQRLGAGILGAKVPLDALKKDAEGELGRLRLE
jgi:hypothetical protein